VRLDRVVAVRVDQVVECDLEGLDLAVAVEVVLVDLAQRLATTIAPSPPPEGGE
jgi:hypothetical protein